jgi:hypothetical protein
VESKEKMRFSLKDIGANVRPECDSETLFSPTVPYSSCFLIIELYFSRNRTDDRSFFSIQGYGASRELHVGALWPR